MAITIQRLMLIKSPISTRFKKSTETKSAWLTILSILIISLMINVWVLYFLEINNISSPIKFCDVKQEYEHIYMYITLCYIGLKMLLPIVIIFVSNFLIILNISYSDKYKQQLTLRENRPRIRSRELMQQLQPPLSIEQNNEIKRRVKPYYMR